MAKLLSLAPELIQIIGSKLDTNDVRAFRLTCKKISNILITEVLRVLTIDFDKHKAKRELHKLRTLATTSLPATRGIKTLNLESLSPGLDLNMLWNEGDYDLSKAALEERIKIYLHNALSSLTSVRTVKWKISKRTTEWSFNAVADILRMLPNLHTLDVRNMDCGLDIPFHMFQGLRQIHVLSFWESQPQTFDNFTKMIAQSPQLSSISVGGDECKHQAGKMSLHDLFHHYPSDAPPLRLRSLAITGLLVRLDEVTMPHLRHLTSLYIDDITVPSEHRDASRDLESLPHDVVMHQKRYGSSYKEIWTIIGQAGLQLEEITVYDVCPAFLDYLGSYSGLKRLCLGPHGFRDGLTSNWAASLFYETLAKHCQSLEELDICACYEGAWCLTSHNLPSFSACPNLKVLHVKVQSNDLILEEDHDGRSTDMGIIKVLIDTIVAYIPRLEELHASVPDPEYNRNLDMASVTHSLRYTRKIITCLKAYRAPPSCKRLPAFTLSAGFQKSFVSQNDAAPEERLRYEIVPSDVRDWDTLGSMIEQMEDQEQEYVHN